MDSSVLWMPTAIQKIVRLEVTPHSSILHHNLQGLTPKAGEYDYETKAKSYIVWVFNCAQKEIGRGTCLVFAAHQWLKHYPPKVALYSQKLNYLTHANSSEKTARQNALLKHPTHSRSAQTQEQTDVQGHIEVAVQEPRTHKEEASAVSTC